jgi:hypothetical protein
MAGTSPAMTAPIPLYRHRKIGNHGVQASPLHFNLGVTRMPTAINPSRAALLKNSLRRSLYLAAAIACLWPALAQAQAWNPTASDLNSNTAAGSNVLPNHATGGFGNTGVGQAALGSNTTGGGNMASGYFALYANTTGDSNTANGYNALISNTTGNNSVAMGYNALTALTSGGSNIALGANAGKNLTNGSRDIYIGNLGIGTGNESNVIRIGQTQTKTFIAGIKGVPVSGATVVVRANGQLGVVASSARYKTDIRDLPNLSDRLTQLRPVSYQYKAEPGVTHYGLIAEEVDKVMPELVVRDEQNRPETVQYHELVPLLLKERQAQQAELARQRKMIEQLTARVDELSRARLAAK